MYVELKKGYDIVYAVTQVKYHKLYRNLGSKLTDKLFNLLFKKPKDKRVSSYRILKKDLRNLILKEKRAYNYISASILKNTKKIGNIHYEHSARKHGNSNYTFLKQLKIFLRIYLYYSNNMIFKFFLKRNEPFIIEKILNTRKEK
jgi:undecaprenyl-phosphate 4-deoxy-4-formamido-L-arabinose transferase